MLIRRPSHDSAPRGQSMVEFALIAPLLALLMVMAVDFGRVFFGWVALQNAARIAADSGAMTADGWADPSNTTVRDQYERTVENDMQAINCSYVDIPNPVFTDVDADGDNYGSGDRVAVTLDCEFQLMTPLAMSLLGGPVSLSADATFRVQKTVTAGLESAPPLPPPCPSGQAKVPDMKTLTFSDAQARWVDRGFAKSNFSPTVTGTNKNNIVVNQTTNPASAPGDCIVNSATVTVSAS